LRVSSSILYQVDTLIIFLAEDFCMQADVFSVVLVIADHGTMGVSG
jgi:hypothetical protein